MSEERLTRKPRADRERNRERVIAAARAAFASADESGTAVSMEDVARAAGVGIATVYRNFPTRDRLAEAVYLAKLDDLTRQSAGLAASTGAQALHHWINRYAIFTLTTRGMIDTVRTIWGTGAYRESEAWNRAIEAITAHLDRGQQDGSLRADVRSDDIAAVLLGLLTACPPGDDSQAKRLIKILMRGITSANLCDF